MIFFLPLFFCAVQVLASSSSLLTQTDLSEGTKNPEDYQLCLLGCTYEKAEEHMALEVAFRLRRLDDLRSLVNSKVQENEGPVSASTVPFLGEFCRTLKASSDLEACFKNFEYLEKQNLLKLNKNLLIVKHGNALLQDQSKEYGKLLDQKAEKVEKPKVNETRTSNSAPSDSQKPQVQSEPPSLTELEAAYQKIQQNPQYIQNTVDQFHEFVKNIPEQGPIKEDFLKFKTVLIDPKKPESGTRSVLETECKEEEKTSEGFCIDSKAYENATNYFTKEYSDTMKNLKVNKEDILKKIDLHKKNLTKKLENSLKKPRPLGGTEFASKQKPIDSVFQSVEAETSYIDARSVFFDPEAVKNLQGSQKNSIQNSESHEAKNASIFEKAKDRSKINSKKETITPRVIPKLNQKQREFFADIHNKDIPSSQNLSETKSRVTVDSETILNAVGIEESKPFNEENKSSSE